MRIVLDFFGPLPTEWQVLPRHLPSELGAHGSLVGSACACTQLGMCPTLPLLISCHFCAVVTLRPNVRSCRKLWTRSWR